MSANAERPDDVEQLLDQAYWWGYHAASPEEPGRVPMEKAHENSAKEVAESIRASLRALREENEALRVEMGRAAYEAEAGLDALRAELATLRGAEWDGIERRADNEPGRTLSGPVIALRERNWRRINNPRPASQEEP